MKLTDKIRDKLPGTSNYYNQKALIWRNRGDSTALEIVDAVRIKYNDKPNVHELSTGEQIPAVPKDYVGNLYGEGSYFCAVEASDDQLVVFKHDFNMDKLDLNPENDQEEVKFEGDTVIDTDLSGKELKQRLIDKDFDAVNFSVLDNRDERFTFLSNELETADNKYSLGHILYDNFDIVLTVTAAVAVAIVMYTMTGDIVPAIKNMAEQITSLNQNIVELQGMFNQTAPPGQ
jgi:hypothetical protein